MHQLQQRSLDLRNHIPDELHTLRDLVQEVDKVVSQVIRTVIAAGKTPIVIGGGHNNAYPVMKGTYQGLGKRPVAVVNIDPHADIRELEGRHSGNGFSYAIADGYLEKYFPIGLHQNYNNTYTWKTLNGDAGLFRYLTAEDMLFGNISTADTVKQVSKFFKGLPVGIEVDMDSIRFTESSARTPVGLSDGKVRKLLHLLASGKNIVYLNLSEGIPSPEGQTGKLQAYLVADFIRARSL